MLVSLQNLKHSKKRIVQFLAESAHADACAPGNPKDASVEDLKDLFRKIKCKKKANIKKENGRAVHVLSFLFYWLYSFLLK